MVSLKINKKRFLGDIGMDESEDLLHRIVMMGVEIEEITQDEIVVDISPNRPDLLSQQGLTRAVKAFLEIDPGLRTYETKKSKFRVRVDDSVKDVRPYTACAVARGLNLDEERLREIIDIQEKLHVTFCRQRKKAAIGIYPLDAISGTITFKALPPSGIRFRPLEAKKEMSAQDILKNHPKGTAYAHLLEGLPKYPVFVDSKNNILSLTPIINSHLTGKVTVQTKDVFIESSGHDFKTSHDVVKMICAALADMGAEIQTVDVIYGKRIEQTPDMSPMRQEFYRYYVNRRLGTKLKKEDLPALLARMGLGFEDGRIRETHYAIIPPYRVDFLHQIDVVEDIAIAYGYENIHAELPSLDVVASESAVTQFQDRIRETLIGHGLLETKSYHLLGKKFQALLGCENVVTLASSVSEGFDSLRQNLVASMLLTLRDNKMHEYPQRLFELGRTFIAKEDGVEENEMLCVALAGEGDYTRIRQVVDSLLSAFGLEGQYERAEDARFLQGRCARVRIGKTVVGLVGEIAPAALRTADLAVPVAACEIDVNALLDALI